MKGELSTLGLVLILSALIFTGCGGATATPTEPPTTAPTKVAVAPTATEQPTESPTAEPTDTQQPTEAPTVAPTRVAVEPEEVAEDEIADWKTYTNERYGYSLRYPPDCTFGPMPTGCKQKPPEERPPECLCFLNAEDPDQVFLQAFTGEKDDLTLATFSVNRLAHDPPPGADLMEYIRERVHYEEIPNEPNATVGGIPAVRFYTPQLRQFSQEEIYFIKDDKALRIYMIDVDDKNNREFYDRVCSALDITVVEAEATGELVDGWVGTIVRLPPGSQFGDYFERDDGQRFGISTVTDTLRTQLQDARWTGAQVKVWGRLPLSPISTYEGRQIQVERLETVSGPAQEPRNLSPFAFPCASSALPTDQWGQYWAWSAIDGLLESAWTEEGHLGHEPWPSGPGIGEWIILVFPEEIVVHRIGVDVGFDRDADVFAKNNRLKRASIEFSKGEFVELTFSDTRGVQMMDIPPVTTTYVRLVINEVYPGSEYDDTCISEIEVWATTQ